MRDVPCLAGAAAVPDSGPKAPAIVSVVLARWLPGTRLGPASLRERSVPGGWRARCRRCRRCGSCGRRSGRGRGRRAARRTCGTAAALCAASDKRRDECQHGEGLPDVLHHVPNTISEAAAVLAMMFDVDATDDYELIDAGDYRRLERFGERVIDRPAPAAVGAAAATSRQWAAADLRFAPEDGWSGAA